MEPIGSAVEALINMIADDALLIVDPNCRPWAVTHEAEYRARLRRILKRADAVKLSEEDLAWLAPGIPLPHAVESLLAAGPSVVLLTCGPRGAVILTPSESIHVASPTVHAVDTIGAGDAFGGAFLAWWRAADLGRQELSDLDQLRSATEFACEVAARTCLQPGAQPPRLVDLEEENLISRFGFGAVTGRGRRT
jgi:fructokinase